MNIIVANKNSSILNSLDIDIIKSLNGEFAIAEIVQLFSNFFFEKIIIDITAIKDVEEGYTPRVPSHINSSAYGYKYPHDYPNHYVVQQYLPDNLKNKKYYIPCDNSKNEKVLKQIKENLDKLKEKNL